MQRVTPDIRDAFVPVEQALMGAFIPSFFQCLGEVTPGKVVPRLPVKQAGLSLPEPTKTAPDNWMASCDITGHLVAALRGQEEFQTANHSAYLQEGIAEVRKQGVLQAE